MTSASYSQSMQRLLAAAADASGLLRHEYIGTEHLLIALLNAPDEPVLALLQRVGIDAGAVQDVIDSAVQRGRRGISNPPYTSRAQEALRRASEEAAAAGAGEIEPAHLLLGLLGDTKSIATVALGVTGITLATATAALAG